MVYDLRYEKQVKKSDFKKNGNRVGFEFKLEEWNMRNIDKIRYIFLHYGEEGQLNKLKEELSELIEEIDAINGDLKLIGNSDFLGEVADVLVMCEQFRVKYPEVNSIMDFKIKRQIGRIKEEGLNEQ